MSIPAAIGNLGHASRLRHCPYKLSLWQQLQEAAFAMHRRPCVSVCSAVRIRDDGFSRVHGLKAKLLCISERRRKRRKAALAIATPNAKDWAQILHQWVKCNGWGGRHQNNCLQIQKRCVPRVYAYITELNRIRGVAVMDARNGVKDAEKGARRECHACTKTTTT